MHGRQTVQMSLMNQLHPLRQLKSLFNLQQHKRRATCLRDSCLRCAVCTAYTTCTAYTAYSAQTAHTAHTACTACTARTARTARTAYTAYSAYTAYQANIQHAQHTHSTHSTHSMHSVLSHRTHSIQSTHSLHNICTTHSIHSTHAPACMYLLWQQACHTGLHCSQVASLCCRIQCQPCQLQALHIASKPQQSLQHTLPLQASVSWSHVMSQQVVCCITKTHGRCCRVYCIMQSLDCQLHMGKTTCNCVLAPISDFFSTPA